MSIKRVLLTNEQVKFLEDNKIVFTTDFEGFSPIQAFGWVNNTQRFYFRIRGKETSLRVGYADQEEENVKSFLKGKEPEDINSFDYYPTETILNSSFSLTGGESLFEIFQKAFNLLRPSSKENNFDFS